MAVRVLLVSAEDDTLSALAHALRGPNYEVHQAGDTQNATRLFREREIQALVFDTSLPDGQKWLKNLSRRYPTLWVVAFGKSPVKSLRFDAFLLEPIRSEALREAVDRVAQLESRSRLAQLRLAQDRKKAYAALYHGIRSKFLSEQAAWQVFVALSRLDRAGSSPGIQQEGYGELVKLSTQAFSVDDKDPPTARFKAAYRGIVAGEIAAADFVALGSDSPNFRWHWGSVRQRDVANFLSQLALLLENGISAVDALETLMVDAAHPRLYQAMVRALDQMASHGRPLSYALGCSEDLFGKTVTVLVQAGEAGGCLVGNLKKAADMLERRANFSAQLKQALSSPSMTLVFGAAVIFAVVKFVMPRFLEVYDQMQLELPALSKFVIGLVHAVNSPVFLVALAVAVAVLFALRMKIRDLSFDWVIRLPLIGGWVGVARAVHLADILASLYEQGIPLQQAFKILAQGTSIPGERRRYLRAQRTLEQEGSLSEAIQEIEYLPPGFYAMCALGEETGALNELLHSLGELLDQQVQHSLGRFLALVEPVILLLIGVTIAVLFTGLFLPVYGIVSQLGA